MRTRRKQGNDGEETPRYARAWTSTRSVPRFSSCLLCTQTPSPPSNSAKRADLPSSKYTWNVRPKRSKTRTSLHLPSGIIHGTCRLVDVLWMTNNGRSCCTTPGALEIALGQGKLGAFCKTNMSHYSTRIVQSAVCHGVSQCAPAV